MCKIVITRFFLVFYNYVSFHNNEKLSTKGRLSITYAKKEVEGRLWFAYFWMVKMTKILFA